MEVQFKVGGRLVGERTRKPVMSKCLFADVCSCRENRVLAANILYKVAGELGLTQVSLR